MNTLKTYLPASILIFSLTLLFNSCSKNEIVQEVNEVTDQSSYVPIEERIESNLKIDNDEALEMIATIKALSSGHLSNKQPTPLAFGLDPQTTSEAIFYLEATLNYDYYREFDSQVDFEEHTHSITIPKNGDELFEEDDLIDAYDDFTDEIVNNEPSGKDVLVVNIFVSSEKSTEGVFEMEVFYSETSGSTIQELDADDDWWAKDQDGLCDNTQSGKDAADRLEELANWYGHDGWNGSTGNSNGGAVTTCAPQTSGYWTNVSTSVAYGNSSVNWPWYGCDNECRDDGEMEDDLADYFTNMYTTAPTRRIFVKWWSSSLTGIAGCNTNRGNHKIHLHAGDLNCGSLPW